MSTAITNIPVKYQFNNNTVVTETINSIAANDTVTLTFSTQINLNSFGTFNLKVWTQKNTDTYTSNDTQDVNITVLNVVSTFPYYENFEADNGNWQASGNLSTWEWGSPANTEINEAANGTKAWVTNLDGNTNSNEVSYLTSPLFNMASISGNPTLSFYHRYSTVSVHKHYIEYTEDGNTWTKLGQNGSGTNWYNHASHYWNNSNSDWEQAEYVFPLSTLSNKTNVRIRFVFENDQWNQKEGVGIDDIFIGHKGTDINMVSVTAPDTTCGLSNAETVSISVQNLSGSATGAFNVHYQLNGGNTVTEQMPSILANSTANFSFSSKANVSATGVHQFKVWHSLMADNYPVNDTMSHHVVNATSVSNFPYLQNFENGNGGWYADGSGTWEWATPSNSNLSAAASGTKAWVTDANGNVPKSSTLLLYSPCFDMSGFANNPTLSFNLARHLQWGIKLWVEYSEDGNTWTKLGQNGSGQNWYDNASNYWTQTQTSFQLASYEIPVSSMTVKTTVRLRFVAQTNPWINAEGLVIDDISIQNIVNDVEAVAFNMVNKGVGLTNQTVTVQVKNNSSVTQNNVFVYYKLNNNAPVKDTISSILSGQTVNFSFTVKANMSATTAHQLMFYTHHAADNYAINDTVSGFEVVNIKYVTTYPYFEDFETDNGTFYAEGWNSTWEHGVPSSNNSVIKRAASGTKAWVTNLDGGYDANESSFLRSPYFDLSGFASNPIIAVSIIHKLEWDPYVYIQYSEDGQQWNYMPATNSGKNWQQFGFSQNRTHWQVVSTEIPLSSITNKDSVQFRVWFDAGFGFDVYDGFGIDNFHIHEKAEMHDGNTVKNINSAVSGNAWIHFASNGKRVASINPQGQNLGNVNVTTYVNTAGTVNFANQYLLNRSWVIEPTNQPTNPVKVRLYMLDTEIETLRSASGCQTCSGIEDAFNLGITKYHGNNQDSVLSNNTSGNYTWIGGSDIKIIPYGKGYCAEFSVTSFSEFFGSGGGINGNTPLPVELTYFSANWNAEHDAAILEWETSQELNNSHFEIQRSLSEAEGSGAEGNWQTIGRVEGNGTTSDVHSYRFIDHRPQTTDHSSPSSVDGELSTIYYRLKQIDHNGNYQYSAVKTLNFKLETLNSFAVYPNPANALVYLSEIANIKLINSNGETLLEAKNVKEIDVSAFPSGIYFLQAEMEGLVINRKLFVE
ncbi:MAG: T9SS type A sorting domain-containing protein [Bacteroidetes bacterium]|nr:T9SS type A sorting domain-containing protein [Bacteroidota bacterium]